MQSRLQCIFICEIQAWLFSALSHGPCGLYFKFFCATSFTLSQKLAFSEKSWTLCSRVDFRRSKCTVKTYWCTTRRKLSCPGPALTGLLDHN